MNDGMQITRAEPGRQSTLIRLLVPLLSGVLLALAVPHAAIAQGTRFVALGGGVTMPSSRGSDAMHNGWMAELMVGITVFDGIIGLRAGANYGQSKVDAMPGGMQVGGMPGVGPPAEGGTASRVTVMLGSMLMPIEIGRFAPYVLADVGTVRSSFRGHVNSFAWQLGGGIMVGLPRTRLYVESRYMQARKGADYGAMVPVTLGLRFPR